MAQKYGQLAAKASKCGTKRFVYTKMWDDRHAFPRHHHRQSDVPWRDCFTFARYRWIVHDFRMFGLWGALKKHYYIGESWRRKDEKIFMGKDEHGNKYWMARRTSGVLSGRLIEPADMHWFRGQSHRAASGLWQKWLQQNLAHTPAQIQARGEYGLNSRVGRTLPFNIRNELWSPIGFADGNYRDPSYIPGPGSLLNPERRQLEEAGYARWANMSGIPQNMPYCGVHDESDEMLHEFYRGQWAFGRASKSVDSDEWKN